MLNSHEIIVMPTLNMRPGEEDWTICFAVPTNAKGIHYIYGRQVSDTRKLEQLKLDVGNPVYGGQEVMTVFDDVFVPKERIFLNGEVKYSGKLVERFAAYHRQSYGGCKPGVDARCRFPDGATHYDQPAGGSEWQNPKSKAVT
jgi:4-hydroxybutyryl-CoA dehydratase/vinylacetyl-CoA-Delta-isomerase